MESVTLMILNKNIGKELIGKKPITKFRKELEAKKNEDRTLRDEIK